jgi:hypothetical protein
MIRRTMPAAALILALGAGVPGLASAQAGASADDMRFAVMWEMADANRDGMVTRKEFMDAMGAAYDRHMSRMKTGRDTASMVKGEMLSAAAIRKLFQELYPGP